MKMAENSETEIDCGTINRLLELADFEVSIAIGVVAGLGVADCLADGPRPVEQLAAETQSNSRALWRTLRALATKNIFEEVKPGVFALSPLSELLRRYTASRCACLVRWL